MMHKSKALLIIDMINPFDFEKGDILAEKANTISKPIKKLKDQFNKENKPVIFINDHYNLWQANLHKIIDLCTNEQSKSVIETIHPSEKDYFLIKPKHSAFYGTALNTLLHHLNVKSLIMTGVAGNICVLFSANDAYMREFEIHVPSNCIASVSDDDNTYALRMIKNVLKGKINPLHETS
ncbi:isochorismatase family cysteine hydrolase [Cytobacillus sp. FJAT-54145]|uniref:Isochorismatase family cysteine hydrolase n=1 Tax=Cytobacillus spartinae TaxID=3299023 RepID=A0ABW6KN81_9BACI